MVTTRNCIARNNMFGWIGKAAKWVWDNRKQIEFIIDILDGNNDNPDDKRLALKIKTRIAEKEVKKEQESNYYA